jgi:hypothetical protein
MYRTIAAAHPQNNVPPTTIPTIRAVLNHFEFLSVDQNAVRAPQTVVILLFCDVSNIVMRGYIDQTLNSRDLFDHKLCWY